MTRPPSAIALGAALAICPLALHGQARAGATTVPPAPSRDGQATWNAPHQPLRLHGNT
jgi:hypothetical protein